MNESKRDMQVQGTLEVKGAVRLRWRNQNMRWQLFLPWTCVPALRDYFPFSGNIPLFEGENTDSSWIPSKQRRRKGTPDRDQLNTLKTSVGEQTSETDIHQEQ